MSTNKFEYWPSNGQLGSTKFTMPTNAEDWPSGDALVGNFVYNEGELVDFIDTKALIANSSGTTTFPYDYVNITVDKSLEGVMTFNQGERTKYFTVTYTGSGNSGDTIVLGTKYVNCRTVEEVMAIDSNYLTNDIVDGIWNQSLEKLEKGFPGESGGCSSGMFAGCSALTTFTSDLSSLTDGNSMFQSCSNLATFTSDLSSLTDSYCMFLRCANLTTFTSDLSSLSYGIDMFRECYNLTTFTSDLSSLTYGGNMFSDCKLTAFTSDLSSLTYGNSMFSNCSNLTTFTSDLSSLIEGHQMFFGCSKLTTFTSDLSSLTEGEFMFYRCKLDSASVKNIAETINTISSRPPIHIGIGNTSPTSEENTYLTQIHNKGWQVYVNGSYNAYVPVTATTDETGETQEAPIPFWAKPVPATEETAKYVDADGNFFNILGAQFIYVDDPDTYGMFTCEEDAAAQMRLTKISEELIEMA